MLVEGGGQGYLKTVCDYVHLNPVRAKLPGAEDRLLGYPWSSLGWLGWSEAQLRDRRKSDPAKLALAARLRRETTLTVGWIAKRLHLVTRKSAPVKLHRWGNRKQKVEQDQRLWSDPNGA